MRTSTIGHWSTDFVKQKKCYLGDSGSINELLLKLAEVYIHEIIRLHDVPVPIIFDQGPHFTLRFWKQLYVSLNLNFDGNVFLPLFEFMYNKSFQSSIIMAPYVALYGRWCRTPLCWSHLSEKKMIGPELIWEEEDMIKLGRSILKKEIEYALDDKLFLKFLSVEKDLTVWSQKKAKSRVYWAI
ncbi:DNA/RNA polymerases superfamily protein [Gossypium australe]|uniref:DNA/RNA polymerases superfamily protein n=1 Tax=Gossypium australe TaxID=47621 RepID=A0A5B6VNS0_9ROSI|nr:DNA/RNA polymerases superfamily protein [Gossypium australe]